MNKSITKRKLIKNLIEDVLLLMYGKFCIFKMRLNKQKFRLKCIIYKKDTNYIEHAMKYFDIVIFKLEKMIYDDYLLDWRIKYATRKIFNITGD